MKYSGWINNAGTLFKQGAVDSAGSTHQLGGTLSSGLIIVP